MKEKVIHRLASRRGFTLIELLVVVAIIGLLASVIIATLSVARTKAAQAAAKELDANFDHNLGDAKVGEWLFDECSGTVARDSSGSGKDGTLTGSPTWSTDTPFGTGCSIAIAGAQYVDVPQFTAASNNITISAWINPANTTSYHTIVSTSAFRFTIPAAASIEWYWVGVGGISGVSNLNSISTNKWQHVLVTKNGNNLRLYVNGVSKTTDAITYVATITGMRVGYDGLSGIGGTDAFNGKIDNVRIYDRALDAMEVQKLCAMDAGKHGLAFVGTAPWGVLAR